MVNYRRGRPAGKSDARDRLLVAGRRHFLRLGYDKATIRGIADEAGVNHALVKYHFGGKEGLFKAVMDLLATPGQAFDQVADAHPDNLARALLTAAMNLWEAPEGHVGLRRLILDSDADTASHSAFVGYIQNQMIGRLADAIGGHDASLKAGAAGATIAGLFFTRYVLRIEPVASMTKNEVVAYFTPALHASLTRPTRTIPLPSGSSRPHRRPTRGDQAASGLSMT